MNVFNKKTPMQEKSNLLLYFSLFDHVKLHDISTQK